MLQNNFIEITLPHGCSPLNLQHIFKFQISNCIKNVKNLTPDLIEIFVDSIKAKTDKLYKSKSIFISKKYILPTSFSDKLSFEQKFNIFSKNVGNPFLAKLGNTQSCL